jgi:uncharacterized repeat protein (TIGR01451 family)
MKTRKHNLNLIVVVTLVASMLFGASGIRTANAATELGPGDIAIVGFSFHPTDNFAFVLLVDIVEGTQIRFTDAGWTDTGVFFTGEGAVRYTAPEALQAGTIISYMGNYDDFEATVEGPFTSLFEFTNAGDQLLAFQGEGSNPTFLYALNNGPGGWEPTNINAQTTYLPTGLEDGYTAISLGGTLKNGVYTGPFSGTREELLASISNPDNWNYTNETVEMPTTLFDVKTGAVLTISKEVDAEERVGLGEEVTYTITLTNSGDEDAEGVMLEDVLPAGLTIGGLVGDSEGTINEAENSLTWSGTVPAIEPVVIEFTATVDDDEDLYDTEIENTASYEWGAESDSDTASFWVELAPVSPAALTISKQVDADGRVGLGEEVTYTITLANSGDEDAEGVMLEDVLPDGLTIGELVGDSQGTINEAENSLTWSGTVPAIEPVVIEFTATVDDDENLYDTEIENTASYEWGAESDSDTASFWVELAPVSPAALTISKDVFADGLFAPGETVSYTITLINHDDLSATNVVMSDILPLTLTVLSVQGGVTSGNTVSWTGSIAGHSSKTIVFSAALSSSSSLFGKSILNTVSFTSANAGQGQASVSFQVMEMPKLYLPVMFSP